MAIKKENRMRLSYTEIFKYSDILNPVSSTALLSAGKLAQMEPKKIVLDLGSGKGFPSLLWASVFGVRVEGFDVNKDYVGYANAHAKMLNLSDRVRYFAEDIKQLRFDRKYDVVASLGLGITPVYGSVKDALKTFKTMLHTDGVLILAEPVWLAKPVSSGVLKALGEAEDSFPTKPEMQRLMEESRFQVLGHFVSSKEDWELYVRPTYITMQEIIESKSELAEEAQRVMNGFKTEYDAVGQHWDMVLWVAKAR
jgi:cyclopropane fatty-acyl-phospholipid synthase-like methyltransferase